MKSTEITVNWDPLHQQYANGRLLGYRVYYVIPPYNVSIVNVTNPNVTQVTLTRLKPRQRYYIVVVAFTSKEQGPLSPIRSVATSEFLQLIKAAL